MINLRKICRYAIGIVAAASVVSIAIAAPEKIEVLYRGVPLKYARGSLPFRSQATILVPLRETATLIGAVVVPSSNTVHISMTFGDNWLYFEPGHHGYKISGRRQNMRSSSEVRKKKLYVPIRLFTDLTSGRIRALIH
jgi:hypothetical protein